LPDPVPTTALVVSEDDVLRAVRSFPCGSSGGPDGLRPQHLADLVNNKECGQTLLASLTAFVNLLLEDNSVILRFPPFYSAAG